MNASDISYYLDFKYDMNQLCEWFDDHVHLLKKFSDTRPYNIIRYEDIIEDSLEVSNYPAQLMREFTEYYNFSSDYITCQYIHIPAGGDIPLHIDTFSRRFTVLFPVRGGTPTVFCNKANHYITEVEHRENIPVLLRADIPHRTQATQLMDKINYQISFRINRSAYPNHASYFHVLDRIKSIDEAKRNSC